ncbi:toll/interleukin-1 receptor domain-containing protein, partial [Nostoc sp.]|uniref:toll/interleukin-1 receptor domain-containing protein n=1 Tax=Nostoc sp. TaxID=1180 RepID=UPI002FF89564
MKIFLAHASEDKPLVRNLHSRLLSHGFKPWLDELDILPGQTWRTAIPRAIRESDIFIACLSQRSVQKQGYIQREFRLALETYAEKPPETIYLIPLKFDNCEIPDLSGAENFSRVSSGEDSDTGELNLLLYVRSFL